jgi:hypothetical protein
MEVFMLKKITLIGAFMAISQAYAANYGMAGCGVGGLVFKDQPGNIQIVAATLNDLISPQTSAISSGTSGCYDAPASEAQVNYIETNKVSLKADVARGNGETLDGLMTMLGCKETKSIKVEIKNNYKNIFNSENTKDIFEAIKNNQLVKASCSTLG